MKINFYKIYLSVLALAASAMMPSLGYAQNAPITEGLLSLSDDALEILSGSGGAPSGGNGTNCSNLPDALKGGAGPDCKYNALERDALSSEDRALLESYLRFFPDKYDKGSSASSAGAAAASSAVNVPSYEDTVRSVWGDLNHGQSEVTVGEFNGGAGWNANNLGTGCDATDFASIIEKELDGAGDLDIRKMGDEFASYAKTALMKEAMTMLFSSPAISAVMDGIKATANARMSMMENSCNAREIMEAARNRVDQRVKAEAVQYCVDHAYGTLDPDKIPDNVTAVPLPSAASGDVLNEVKITCSQPTKYQVYAKNYYYKFSYDADLHSQLCFVGERAYMLNCNRCKAGDQEACGFAQSTAAGNPAKRCSGSTYVPAEQKGCKYLAYVSNLKVETSASGGVTSHGRRFTPKQVTSAGLLGAAAAIGSGVASMYNYVFGRSYQSPEEVWESNYEEITENYRTQTKIPLTYGSDSAVVPVMCFCRASKSFEQEIYGALVDSDYSYSLPTNSADANLCRDYSSMMSNVATNTQTGLSSLTQNLTQEVQKATTCIYWNSMTAREFFEMESYLGFNERKSYYRAMSVVSASEAQQEIFKTVRDELSSGLAQFKSGKEYKPNELTEGMEKEIREYDSIIAGAQKNAEKATTYSGIAEVKAAIAKAVREARKGHSKTTSATNKINAFGVVK